MIDLWFSTVGWLAWTSAGFSIVFFFPPGFFPAKYPPIITNPMAFGGWLRASDLGAKCMALFCWGEHDVFMRHLFSRWIIWNLQVTFSFCILILDMTSPRMMEEWKKKTLILYVVIVFVFFILPDCYPKVSIICIISLLAWPWACWK